MRCRITNERFFHEEGSASGRNGFGWVAGIGAGSREKRVARRCGVEWFGRCCEATNPCFSKSDDVSGLWLSRVQSVNRLDAGLIETSLFVECVGRPNGVESPNG